MSETMSELNELAAALAKAQGEIVTIQKDSDNPYFKSKYASLPAVREAVREAFARHGLSVVQIPEVDQGRICLHTLLLHSSGQQLNCGTLSAEVDLGNPQKMGSCLTYFRRYSLAAISQCVADDGEDDDGNAASAPSRQKQTVKLTGHDVVKLQGEINDAPTTDVLSAILHGDTYKQLKTCGPEDAYQQTAKLAKAKHTLLTTTADPIEAP